MKSQQNIIVLVTRPGDLQWAGSECVEPRAVQDIRLRRCTGVKCSQKLQGSTIREQAPGLVTSFWHFEHHWGKMERFLPVTQLILDSMNGTTLACWIEPPCIIRNGVDLQTNMVIFKGLIFLFFSHGNYLEHGFSFKHLMGNIRTMAVCISWKFTSWLHSSEVSMFGILVTVVFHSSTSLWVPY